VIRTGPIGGQPREEAARHVRITTDKDLWPFAVLDLVRRTSRRG
jgi:hypothetical protein